MLFSQCQGESADPASLGKELLRIPAADPEEGCAGFDWDNFPRSSQYGATVQYGGASEQRGAGVKPGQGQEPPPPSPLRSGEPCALVLTTGALTASQSPK